LLNDAANAMGGLEKINAVQSLVLEGEGTQYNLGQDLRPGARGQTFTVSNYRRAVDLAAPRWREEMTRKPNFAYFQGPAERKQVQGHDGSIGWRVGGNGAATRATDEAAKDLAAERLHHPLVALRAALAVGATRSAIRSEGRDSLIDVALADGQRYSLVINGLTKLPARVVTRTSHANLADVATSTSFEDYADVGGIKLPAKLTTAVDDFATQELRLAGHGVGAATGDLAAPADAAAAPAMAGPPAPNVTAENVARGVWLLAGQSHHSVLVEFADHAVLIEAPQNEARTLAVLAKAKELLPAKPVTKLVVTHHHFDHTGGLRAAVASGLTVYTHQGNVSSLERLAERPSTIAPDLLAREPKEPHVESIGNGLTLSDRSMTLQLIPMTNPHSETMLIAWLPDSRLVVEADLYSPGPMAETAFADKFLQDVGTLKLKADRIVPIHGAVVPFSQLAKDLAAAKLAK
jgi:glyoxylase-like metal-dependent hydrolase (beta-lactamase superfamily II)